MSDYDSYLSGYRDLSTEAGYYTACEFLAYKEGRWAKYGSYVEEVEKAIYETTKRLKKTKLNMADISCGTIAFLPRHFSKYANSILCVDSSNVALKQVAATYPGVKVINDDTRSLRKVKSLNKRFDFIYLGFNAHPEYIKNLEEIALTQAGIFIMKSKAGDDLYLRTLLGSYDMAKRYKEINTITSEVNSGFSAHYLEKKFLWKFVDEDIDRVLAALSVVGLKNKGALSQHQYNIGRDFLSIRSKGNSLELSQILSIWKAIKS
ncbi:MAG: hypothetical protein AAB669_04090 [Patescibacteria group bacterium]